MYFKLFACCFPVRGASRSVICDVDRNDIFYIPNVLYEIIIKHADKPIAVLHELYPDMDLELLFSFLLDNELGFWTDEPELFPEISKQWDSPGILSNAIIDSNSSSNHDYFNILRQLYQLGCKHIEFRSYDLLEVAAVEQLLQLINTFDFFSCEFVIKYHHSFSQDYLLQLTDSFPKIKTLTLHTAEKDELLKMGSNEIGTPMGNIIYVKQAINSNTHCGNISSLNFVFTNYRAIIEAHQYNSCLNKKISIDVDGAIKNCPTLQDNYGNVKDTLLYDVLLHTEVKKLWNITKEQVHICQDCEFRMVCTDCRAIVSEPGNLLSKPLKCTYDPYKMVWE